MESNEGGVDLEAVDDVGLARLIDACLDRLTDERLRCPTDADRLDLLEKATIIQARVTAWQQRLAAETEQAESCWHAYRTSTRTWLVEHLRFTPREASRLIGSGEDLARFDQVGRACLDGEVLPAQAGAITQVMGHLPADLDREQTREAERTMVGFAATHTSAELRLLSQHLVRLLAPEQAEADEALRVQAEYRRACRDRHLVFRADHHGQVTFHGALPVAEAEPWIRILDSYLAAGCSGEDQADPRAEVLTPAMRRADALMAMIHDHAVRELAPASGGDRPRAVITLGYDTLRRAALDDGDLAGRIVGTGEPVPAGVLRRWLCDAEILPVVLGGDSEVLDVGRAHRLATPSLRAALEVRDAGCVFPGCDQPPHMCHAHHIHPWWAGGRTCLGNLVLVCPHHHRILEPTADPPDDQWQVRIRTDGTPEVIPPLRVDPAQTPRLHARYQPRISP